MKMTSRHGAATRWRGPTLAVMGSLLLLAAACGSSKTKAATAPAAVTTTPAGVVVNVATAKLGKILVNTQGRTLYTFDPENSGTIVCLTGCVDTWPPDLSTAGSAPTAGTGVTVAIATIARPDGGTQVTAGGHPLYTYSGDKAAGDTNGDGIAGKWHAARPSGSTGSAAPAPAATPTTQVGYKY